METNIKTRSAEKFRHAVFKHMGIYKRDVLGKDYTKEFMGKKRCHILEEEDKLLNIIDKSTQEKFDSEKFPFHTYFSHMSSSQAMAINLFYPLIKNKKLALLNDLLGCNIMNEAEGKLEYPGKDGSEYDFCIENGLNKIIFEVKYTEDTFHTKPTGKNVENRFGDFYKEDMGKILIDSSQAELLVNTQYQLWRNIINVAEDDNMVAFVFPKERGNLTKQVKEAISLLKDEYKDKVKILYTQDMYEKIKVVDENNYNEFKKKYFLIEDDYIKQECE